MQLVTVSFVRHAKADYPKNTLPPYDPDLAAIDQEDFTRLAEKLPIGEWWISPLKRCQQTAHALIKSGAKPTKQKTDPRLEEQYYGDWHGKTTLSIWEEIADKPKSNWHFLHPSITPPKGESFLNLRERLKPVMADIISQEIGQGIHKHIILVTHAMVIRAMIGLALGRDADEALAIEIAPLSLCQLTYMPPNPQSGGQATGGQWQINCINS